MKEGLEELLERLIDEVDKDHLSERVVDYKDYKTKYTVLKPSVKVKVELTKGKVFTIDISDYFKGIIK